jgi:hypothetical protein
VFLVSRQRCGLLGCQEADAARKVSGGNARGEMGNSVEKRLAMLCSVGRKRRKACGDVPLGCAEQIGRRVAILESGSMLVQLRA